MAPRIVAERTRGQLQQRYGLLLLVLLASIAVQGAVPPGDAQEIVVSALLGASLLLAFWAAGNFGHKAFLLIVWVGASALIGGITQISYAFELREHAGPAEA